MLIQNTELYNIIYILNAINRNFNAYFLLKIKHYLTAIKRV